MQDKTKIILVVLALVVIGLPLIGKLAQSDNQTAKSAESGKAGKGAPGVSEDKAVPAKSAARRLPTNPGAVQPAPGTQPAGPQPQAGRPAMPQPPARPAGPAALDPNSLVGSVWSVRGAMISLFAGGQATAQHPSFPAPIQGTWSVNGNTLTISAMGQTVSATFNGSQFVANGMPITRIR